MLEQVISEHLQSSEVLAAKLAVYDGKPAVFHYKEPADDDPEWQGEARYGRIVFSLQIRDDPSRRKCGSLAVDVLSETDTQRYKDMEPIVRNCLDGYFFVSNDQMISLKWVNKRASKEFLTGVTMNFQVYSYPVKVSQAVNPASLMCGWCRGFMENIGRTAYYVGTGDPFPAVFRPTAEKPVFYWRLTKIEPCAWLKDMPAADWRTATLQGHVIAPGQSEEEAALVLWLDQAIEKAERITSEELSLFVSRDDNADLTADSMEKGQLTVKAAYGISPDEEVSEKLQNVSIEMR